MTNDASISVSIVTAVRNARSTIESCLDSVQAQSYVHREQVVVDGASTDGTTEILRQRRNRVDVLISERDTGIYNALNKGIQLCSGDIIGFLHADDIYADESVIARVVDAFRDPRVSVVYGDLLYVSKDDVRRTVRYWKAGSFDRRKLALGWMPPHPTLYVRRAVYEEVGGFDETYRIAADYDSMLRILARGSFGVAYLPEVLVKMRVGGASNASLRNILRKSAEDYRALRRNRVGGLASLLAKNIRKVPQFFEKAT